MKRVFGMLVVFCMATCFGSFVAFADNEPTSSVSETTETTTVSSDTQTVAVANNSYSFVVSVTDADTGEQIDGVNVRLEKRWYEDDPDKSHWDCYTGETEVLVQWNTSDANPFIADTYEWEPGARYEVFAVIDELPDGYSYYGRSIAEYSCGGDLGSANDPFSIELKLQKEPYMDMEFPICGTYSETIRFVDAATNEPIENLDCVLVNMQTGEELYAWNTSEEPIAEISGLEYCFTNWHMNPEYKYAVQFRNMPDNYVVFYGKSKEFVYLLYTPQALESGETLLEAVVFLENTDPDAAQVTRITSAIADTSETRSTETKATETISDSELCEWAAKDYQDKTGTAVKAEIAEKSDEAYEISLTDEGGNVLDTYKVNPQTGIGSDSAGTEVNLPQTGINDRIPLVLIFCALLSVAGGWLVIRKSDIVQLRKER